MILAASIDLVKKSGAWYAYEGEKIGQGRENAKAYLENHPEVMEELDRKVRAHYDLPGQTARKKLQQMPGRKMRKSRQRRKNRDRAVISRLRAERQNDGHKG